MQFMYPFSRRVMQQSPCPQCNDFLVNSEKAIIETLSPIISAEADKYAYEKAAQTGAYIDYYMLFYRIKYTQLLNEKKQTALDDYKATLSSKYIGRPDLCEKCTSEIIEFETNATFCFHITEFESDCANCQKKMVQAGIDPATLACHRHTKV